LTEISSLRGVYQIKLVKRRLILVILSTSKKEVFYLHKL